MIHPSLVPGFEPAARAIRAAGGIMLGDQAAATLALVALEAARPHMQAEGLADLADDMLDMALALSPGDESGVLFRLSVALDQASHDIRGKLTR